MPIICVFQRVLKATLLINNVDKYVSIGKGVILYVSILKNTTQEDVRKAINNILQCKGICHPVILNDKEEAVSIADSKECDVLVIPQASMSGKIKGKQIQYHSLIEKTSGEKIYLEFCDLISKGISGNFQHGVFGNRQALNFESDGPYTHVFEL